MHSTEYRSKLTTPEKAVAAIKEGSTLIYGMAMAEPPALLEATARRLRAGDLKKLTVFTSLPLRHAMNTVLSPDLVDRVDVMTSFVSGGERGLVRAGLNLFRPALKPSR